MGIGNEGGREKEREGKGREVDEMAVLCMRREGKKLTRILTCDWTFSFTHKDIVYNYKV